MAVLDKLELEYKQSTGELKTTLNQCLEELDSLTKCGVSLKECVNKLYELGAYHGRKVKEEE
jgi:hypothetical protein